MGRCTSRSILRAPLRQSCLDLTIGTGWWADMRTAQARLMDSSLSRQTNSPLSIIPDRPLHRLTESMTKGVICGRYVDASGIAHGFLARITGTPPTTAGGAGNEGERFPVAGHSTQPVALGVGKYTAGALRITTFILHFKTQPRTNQGSLFGKCAARRVNLPAESPGG